MADGCAVRGELQSDRMSRFESACWYALGHLPAWRPFVVRRDVRRGVETQARDDRVSVAVARVDGDPFASAALAVLAKFSGANRRFQ